MARTGSFLSTVAAVFSHSSGSLTHPTPTLAAATLSSTSLNQLSPRPSTSSSHSVASSKPSTESKRSKKPKKSRPKKIKQHNEVWWTLTTPYKGEYREFLPKGQVVHEWSHMYF